jgi:hypothetical protein
MKVWAPRREALVTSPASAARGASPILDERGRSLRPFGLPLRHSEPSRRPCSRDEAVCLDTSSRVPYPGVREPQAYAVERVKSGFIGTHANGGQLRCPSQEMEVGDVYPAPLMLTPLSSRQNDQLWR